MLALWHFLCIVRPVLLRPQEFRMFVFNGMSTYCTALQLGQAGRLLLCPQDEGKLIVWCVRRGEVRKN